MAPAGHLLLVMATARRCRLLQETADREEIIERVAALDIGKASVVCCARIPDDGRRGRRLQEVLEYSTMTGALLRLADRLRAWASCGW